MSDKRNVDRVKPTVENAAAAHSGANGHAGSSNGNGNGGLPSLSEGKIDFVMRSFEATMALPAEEPVDVADTVVREAHEAGN
jgi:hypothetical protein